MMADGGTQKAEHILFSPLAVYITNLGKANETYCQYLYKKSKHCSTWLLFAAMIVVSHDCANIYVYLCSTFYELRMIQAVLHNVNNNKLYINSYQQHKNHIRNL